MKAKRMVLAGVGVAAAMALAACGDDEPTASGSSVPATLPQPSEDRLAASHLGDLPVAPASDRVDVAAPTFSDPTNVTNPLFPISELDSVILNGRVDDQPFHTETTLLPETRIIEWADGEQVETLVSQYVAYLDGRMEEAALDYYAQADDGAVWYFGEEVYNYTEDGVIFDTDGTWLAGRDGPPAMIMPGDPQVGDVHRPENIPSIAFEEVEIKTVDKTVDGPQGPVEGAIVGRELHDDGSYSGKTFAPGYGEFFSAHEGDVEALALAVPTDALPGVPPAELEALSSAADELFDAAQAEDWQAAAVALDDADAAWDAYQNGDVPPRIATELNRAIEQLTAAIDARDRFRAATTAIDVAQSTLDLDLRYQAQAEIDLARFELWVRQLQVDTAEDDLGATRSDVATLEWVRDRFATTLDPVDLTRIDTRLLELRTAVADKDLAATRDAAASLRDELAQLAATPG